MKSVLKVNIGCGPQSKFDWVNLDYGIVSFLSKFPWLSKLLVKLRLLADFHYHNIPRLYDCTKRLPFKDSSVDFIYASHFIEHLHRYEAIRFLGECRRVLRKGGVLRIAVPDLKLLAEKYINGDRGFFSSYFGKIDHDIFGNIADLFVASFYGLESGDKVKPGFLNKIKDKLTRGHHWMYDFTSLKEILEAAGFVSVNRCNPKEGDVPDIDFLDIFPLGLYLEASNEAKII